MGGGGMDGRDGRRPGQEKASQEQGRYRTRGEGGAGTQGERAQGLAGRRWTAKETEKAETEADKEEGGPFKEVTKGYRWVAITGTLDHGQMLANYRRPSRTPPSRTRNTVGSTWREDPPADDGTWSDLEEGRRGEEPRHPRQLPANEEELAPVNVLPEGLVDPLPFLNAGLWEKVHIASLVPKEKVELPEEPKAQAGMGGGADGGHGMGIDDVRSMMQQQQNMRGCSA